MKRKAINESPLDRGPLDRAIMSFSDPSSAEIEAMVQARRAKERATFMISKDVMDRLRNMVFWTPGLTMSDTVDQVLAEFIEKQEKNVETDVKKRGEPFPPRTRQMLRGRPVRK